VRDQQTLKKCHVYVIDDDSAVLESMAFLLDAVGYPCATFSDGSEFLAKVGTLARGCIVTDFQMPGMNGYELYAAIRARSIDWPICLMSSTRKGLAPRAKALGFIDFLPKPIAAETLVRVLDRAEQLLSPGPGTT